jgi:hypothetical protein
MARPSNFAVLRSNLVGCSIGRIEARFESLCDQQDPTSSNQQEHR